MQIQHDSTNLRRLVAKATLEDLDLVSLMVLSGVKVFGNGLIPTFVFFFQNSTPFAGLMTRQPSSSSRGCILIRYEALTRRRYPGSSPSLH